MSIVGYRASNHPQQVGRRGALAKVDDRATHPDDFAEWNERFNFTIDVAAAAHNTKCPRYFTVEQNGLVQHRVPGSERWPGVDASTARVRSAAGRGGCSPGRAVAVSTASAWAVRRCARRPRPPSMREEPMALRFDQCDETCTTDCGHCKGRPVEALRAGLRRLGKLVRSVEIYGTGYVYRVDGEEHVLHPSDVTVVIAADQQTEIERQRAEVASLRQQLDEARGELSAIDEMLRECGIEYPLGAAGVRDLAAMAAGRLEELQGMDALLEEGDRARADRDRLLVVYRAAEAALVDAHAATNAVYNQEIGIGPEISVREGWYRAECYVAECGWSATGAKSVVEDEGHQHAASHRDLVGLAEDAIELIRIPLRAVLDSFRSAAPAEPVVSAPLISADEPPSPQPLLKKFEYTIPGLDGTWRPMGLETTNMAADGRATLHMVRTEPATVWTPAKDGDTPGQRDIEDDPPQPIMASVPVDTEETPA